MEECSYNLKGGAMSNDCWREPYAFTGGRLRTNKGIKDSRASYR